MVAADEAVRIVSFRSTTYRLLPRHSLLWYPVTTYLHLLVYTTVTTRSWDTNEEHCSIHFSISIIEKVRFYVLCNFNLHRHHSIKQIVLAFDCTIDCKTLMLFPKVNDSFYKRMVGNTA